MRRRAAVNGSEDSARRSGFLSETDKRKFTTAAGILGAVFFVLQFAGPMLAMFAAMPTMMFGNGFKTYVFEGGALFRGELYVVEMTERFGRMSEEASRSRLVKAGGEQIEEVVPLEGWEPELLADGERLWLISSSRMSVYTDGRLNAISTSETLGDICRPFLFRGAPTLVENRPDGGRLLSWTGEGWERIRDLPNARGSCHFQPLPVDDSVWLFRRDGKTLYFQDAMSENPRWTVVMARPSEWYAFLRDGRPAVASSDFENGFRIVRHDGEQWVTVASSRESLGMSRGIAVFEASDDSLLILSQTFPGSLTVRRWDAQRPEVLHRYGSGFPFPSSMMWIMMIPYLGTMALSLLLAVILSNLMKVHRVTTYRHGSVEFAYASLARRAFSQGVDALIAGLPVGVAYWRILGDFAATFERGPRSVLETFAWFGAAIVWMGLVFLAFSVAEGYWGTTPGKWLFGIRVVGTDLRPCGFGRALIRNLLKFVDGFFNFLVGILLVAFTPEWQRLGDLAARTIVIRATWESIASVSATD
jgi:uncharacterized RDD family membrane protein YckC